MKYIMLAIATLAMGLFTNGAVTNFQQGSFFSFGLHLALTIYWACQVIQLAFDM